MVHGSLLAEEVEAAFTSTVVALCRVSKDDSCRGLASKELNVLDQAEIVPAQCLALAFVHAFDFACMEVVLYTPAPVESLKGVNAILRGDISWEPHFAPRGA